MQNNKLADLLHKYFELGVAEGREGRNHDTEGGDAQRVLSEIEAEIAALSSARPIGFTDASELKNKERHGLFAHIGADTSWLNGPIALYAAPPAPPAAVQALEWIVSHPAESNAVVWDVAQNALSGHVQDVAGWQPIETLKPKHGDAVMGWVKVSGSFCAQPIYYSDFDRQWRIKLNGALVEEVTDYQSLPAAPAKHDQKPLDLNITKEWFEKRAKLEGDHETGAGCRKITACIDPTPEELAELYRIAHRIPEGWNLVPTDATDKMIAAALDVDWSNENEIAAVHNIWHSMVAAALAKQEG